MKIMLLGDRACEHAMAEALGKSHEVYSVMKSKNPGIAGIVKGMKVSKSPDAKTIEALSEKWGIDYIVPGPSSYRWERFVEAIAACKTGFSGPCANAAKIGTDHSYLRELMQRNSCPGRITYGVFDDLGRAEEFIDVYGKPVAIRAVESGGGVRLMGGEKELLADLEKAKRHVAEMINKGKSVVIEELLEGVEFSLPCFVDDDFIYPLPAIHETRHSKPKKEGQITPGMGGYYSGNKLLPFMEEGDYKAAVEAIESLIGAMRKEGAQYQGEIAARFILGAEGPKLIEIVLGLGDPGAMLLLPMLKSDYAEIWESIMEGELESMNIQFEGGASVCKYLVPKGYPGKPSQGKIELGEKAKAYYNDVSLRGGSLHASKGRALAVVGIGKGLAEASEDFAGKASQIKGLCHREDIATKEYIAGQTEYMASVRKEPGK